MQLSKQEFEERIIVIEHKLNLIGEMIYEFNTKINGEFELLFNELLEMKKQLKDEVE